MSDLEQVVGIRLRNAGKLQYFHSGGMRLEPGEYVVVESSHGPEVGRVVIAPGQVVVNELGNENLPPILRLATEGDLRRASALTAEAEELLPKVRALAAESRFQGHVEKAEFTLDRRRLTISFSSEERVEYRDLIRAVSNRFDVRTDARMLGARDRARMAGGYGVCGRELCCSSWLNTFPAISIRMAKEQDLPLNPQKISGLCGRLLCCLSYEEQGYKEMRKTLPKLGQRCSTPTGEGKVISVNTLRRQVTLYVEGKRIEVTDRDLGTVVRWDPASKAADPPPSISREEGIAQGLIEDTPEPEEAGVDWEVFDPGPGRGRLPGGGPRKVIRSKPEPAPAEGQPEPAARQPRGAGRRGGRNAPPRSGGDASTQPQQRPTSQTPSTPPGGRARSFRRAPRDESGPPSPPETRPTPPRSARPPGGDTPAPPANEGDQPQGAPRRRGRRGGRGRRGPGGGDAS